MDRAGHSVAGRRAAIARAFGPALLPPRPGTAPRHRELSGRPEGRHRRHRRAVAPGAWRTRRLQQHGVGRAVPRPDRERPRAAHRDDAGRVGDTRRHGGRRGHHVAGHARGPVFQRAQDASELLPAVDDGHRDPDLRKPCNSADRERDGAASASHGRATRRRRGAPGHLSVLTGDQRARLPPQQVPARDDASRAPGAFPRGRGGRVRGRGAHAAGARPGASARLARVDPLRRHLLHAGEARRGRRRVQPPHLRGHAWRDAGGVPANAQRPRRAVFGRRQGCQGASMGYGARGRQTRRPFVFIFGISS